MGVAAVVIAYRNQKDALVNEVLIFDGEAISGAGVRSRN